VNTLSNLRKPRRWRTGLSIDHAGNLREQLGRQIIEQDFRRGLGIAIGSRNRPNDALQARMTFDELSRIGQRFRIERFKNQTRRA
jgi:hypothetical protein